MSFACSSPVGGVLFGVSSLNNNKKSDAARAWIKEAGRMNHLKHRAFYYFIHVLGDQSTLNNFICIKYGGLYYP